jgi:hypothetical protein
MANAAGAFIRQLKLKRDSLHDLVHDDALEATPGTVKK